MAPREKPGKGDSFLVKENAEVYVTFPKPPLAKTV
jgi:hypothetical protein